MILPLSLSWLVTIVIAAFAVRALITRADRWGLVDTANERSLHSGSTPRSGGLGILVAIACGWVLGAVMGYSATHWLSLSLAGVALAGVSLLDDLRDISPLPRFAVHLLAGATPTLAGDGLGDLAVPGATLELGFALSFALTTVFVVWSINLYNFMDGMDGFAAGMTFLGFGFLALLGVMDGRVAFALTCAVISASATGFLLFNFPPARVFMGDAGAATLGFLAAACILWADAAGIAPLWIGVMIFSPFFLDATITVIRRALSRERIWQAHRTHYYQRAVQAGWSHRRTVLVEYALMIGCGVTALWIVNTAVWVQWSAIAVWLAIYSLCMGFVHMRELSSGESSSASR